MKKLFSKIETKIDPPKESKGGQSLVGKVFQIGKHNTVTVEDIIAEGNFNLFSNNFESFFYHFAYYILTLLPKQGALRLYSWSELQMGQNMH